MMKFHAATRKPPSTAQAVTRLPLTRGEPVALNIPILPPFSPSSNHATHRYRKPTHFTRRNIAPGDQPFQS